MNLLQRFRAWRKRRYWQSRQLEHLAVMIRSDWRWLAHDPVARELTDRYVRALRDDWYTLPHEDSGAFRTRIGLDPKREDAPPDPDIQQAVKHVLAAKGRNDQMQSVHTVGTKEWHGHETIDDQLFEALTVLGA